MPLREVNLSDTRRFEDDGQYLVLRTQLSKHEGDRVSDASRQYHLDPATAEGDDAALEISTRTAEANALLFEILAVEWSLSSEPTAGAYRRLDEESGRWVDTCIETVLQERRARAEKNAPSSKRRSKPATS